MIAPQPAVLDVTHLKDGRYRFALRDPAVPFIGATDPNWFVRVHDDTIGVLCSKLHVAVHDANSGARDDTGADELRKSGSGLYQELLPVRPDPNLEILRRRLRELTTPLVISADPSAVPWELLYDREGDEFLGLSHQVARSLKTSTQTSDVAIESSTPRCLLIADPNEDEADWELPETAAEADQLRAWLVQRGVSCDLLTGSEATYPQTLDRLLDEPYDVIHYAGHIVYDERNCEWAWRLHEGRLLAAAAIGNQLAGRPLMFLNGCWSAAAPGSHLAGVEAMTEAMLKAGAGVVVGSTYPVPEAGARMFAERFYDELLDGETLGAAMLAARTELSRHARFRATWASFVLYGNPCESIAVARREPAAADHLGRVLDEVGVAREVLDGGAQNVLLQALTYAVPVGWMGTPHLFAAMVAGSDPTLRDRLAALDVPAEALRDSFQSAFRSAAEAATGNGESAPVELTANLREILGVAAKASGEQRPLTESTLLDAFVAGAGGNTRSILEALGIDVRWLAPPGPAALRDGAGQPDSDAQPPAAVPPDAGTASLAGVALTAEVPDREAVIAAAGGRDPLELAQVIAANLGHSGVSGVHLFCALLAVTPSPLAAALGRLRVSESWIKRWRVPASYLLAPAEPLPAPRLSDTVAATIDLARMLADQRGDEPVGAEDLLNAFVERGGGKLGKDLYRRAGVPIAALTSAILDEQGELDKACLDASARAALDEAVRCARSKHHAGLTRTHLLCGLLRTPGTLTAAIRAQGHDPDAIADRAFVRMRASAASAAKPSLTAAWRMSPGLIACFCAAESRRKEANAALVAEAHVSAALLSDGGGHAGELLVEAGVRWLGLPR